MMVTQLLMWGLVLLTLAWLLRVVWCWRRDARLVLAPAMPTLLRWLWRDTVVLQLSISMLVVVALLASLTPWMPQVSMAGQPDSAQADVAHDGWSELATQLSRSAEYPAPAWRLGLQGDVQVGFTLNVDGSVDAVELVASSGEYLLDEAALAQVRAHLSGQSRQLPAVEAPVRVVVPMVYRLQVPSEVAPVTMSTPAAGS